jgi:hypothetical protein
MNNHQILLSQLFESKRAEFGSGLSEANHFEYFVTEMLLRDQDLSFDEMESGMVDGGNDGGIDTIYTFVNDVLIQEDTDPGDVKRYPRV